MTQSAIDRDVRSERIDQAWDFNKPDESESRFRTMLADETQASHVEQRAEVLTQLARTQGLQRQFEAAHATLNEADLLIDDEAMPVARVRYLLERGRVYNSSNHPDQARPLFVEALARAKSCHADFYAVDAAHMLGIVDKGDDSLEWNRQAIELAEKSKIERARKWLGSLYNNTGWTYHDMGDFDSALKLFQKALAFREEQGDAETIRIAKWCVARCYRSLGRIDEALAVQEALAAEHAAAGTKDGYVQEELGECLLALDRGDEARPHFAKAYDLLSQDSWLTANEPLRLARLRQLGGG